jgi:uncharacterized protein YegL
VSRHAVRSCGLTDMGAALEMLAADLGPDVSAVCPPVLVLLSDGYPTDDFNKGLRRLMQQPRGAMALRIAIAIGNEADLETLQRFIGDARIPPAQARNPDELAKYDHWASTVVLQSASRPNVDVSPVRRSLADLVAGCDSGKHLRSDVVKIVRRAVRGRGRRWRKLT